MDKRNDLEIISKFVNWPLEKVLAIKKQKKGSLCNMSNFYIKQIKSTEV